MTQAVVIVDSVDDVLMTALIRPAHFDLMMARGWIKSNGWLFPDKTVYTMPHTRLVEFLEESAL